MKYISLFFSFLLFFTAFVQKAHGYASLEDYAKISVPENHLNTGDTSSINVQTGASTTSYSLDVPPGTNNLTPKIIFNYNSLGAKGSVGVVRTGWDIATDYIQRDVNYTPTNLNDDKFRLILNGTSYDLISTGQDIYHTKIESNLYIKKETTGGQNSKGEYWVVKTPEGTSYRFGYKNDSENMCSNRDYVWRWSLESITDTHNNNIYYSYSENPTANDIGAVYPFKIEYNNDKKRVIQFALDSVDRPDSINIYDQGCSIAVARRITETSITTNGAPTKKYALNYSSSVASKSLLQSITHKGNDDSSLPPTTFQYNQHELHWNTTFGTWMTGGPTLYSGGIGGGTILADATGDGLPDIVTSSTSNGWRVYRNNGSGWNTTFEQWGPNAIPALSSSSTGGGTLLADVTGDGLPDVVNSNTSNGWRIYRNTGTSWNTTFEQWGPNTVPALITGSTGGGTMLTDINGDSLQDVVQSSSSTGWTAWLNTGIGFNTTSASWGNNTFPALFTRGTTGGGTLLMDVNGDGLQDLVNSHISNGWRVWLNTGNGFNSTMISWATNAVPAFFATSSTSGGTILADANGDDLPDVVNSRVSGGVAMWVYLNNGKAWNTTPQQWTSGGPIMNISSTSNNTILADANGDSLLDWVNSSTGTWRVYLNQGYAPDLLSQIKTTSGGTTSFNYLPSTKYDNKDTGGISRLFTPLWVVEKRTNNNGMSGSHATNNITTYSYKGGLYNTQQREFRGFAQVDETEPSTAKKQYIFHQSDGLKGLLLQSQTSDSQSNPYIKKVNTWSSAQTNGIHTNKLDNVRDYTYDGVAASPKILGTDYQYDNYGNITKKSELGDINTNGDEKYTYNEYVYNTSLWIVNKIKHLYLKAADNATTVSESWNYYDLHPNLDDVPTKGDLTKTTQLLSGGTNPVTQFEYDSNGNKTKETDANNRITQFVFGITDTTRTFPERIINPKNQATNITYDLATGKELSKTDPNAFVTSYTYDAFGRPSKEIQQYDNSSLPTVTYSYFNDGAAPEGVLVSKRKTSGSNEVYKQYTFTDGFGRKVQTKSDAEDTSKQIVTNTFYDQNGQILRETVPHIDIITANYSSPLSGVRDNVFTYDAVKRVKTVVNPKGDTQVNAYDHWSNLKTDENGHKKKYYYDAYNNIIRIEEIDSTATYTTNYAYNAQNLVTSITDATGKPTSYIYDTLGRKTTQTDPDMGIWKYEYDGVGNIKKVTDNRGIATINTYDELNRLLKSDYPTNTDSIYVYDSNKIGALAKVTDAAGQIDYIYDNRLRKIEEKRVLDSITWITKYGYNAQDQIISRTNPDGEIITYAFNQQGEIDSVSGIIINLDYNAQNNITKKAHSNSLTTNYAYNSDDFRLNKISTAALQDVSYAYDKVGNVSSIVDNKTSKTQTFGYDYLDRLLSAQETGGYNYSYSYNSIGNILSFINSGSTINYIYGENNAGIHALTSSTETLSAARQVNAPISTITNSPTPASSPTSKPTTIPTTTTAPTAFPTGAITPTTTSVPLITPLISTPTP